MKLFSFSKRVGYLVVLPLGLSFCKSREFSNKGKDAATKNFEQNPETGMFSLDWPCAGNNNTPMLVRESLIKKSDEKAFLASANEGLNKGRASCAEFGDAEFVKCTEKILDEEQKKLLKLPAGFIKQDEYCEWDIKTRKDVSEPLECRFTVSFDTGRSIFLNRNENEDWLAVNAKTEATAWYAASGKTPSSSELVAKTEELKEAHRDLALSLRTVTNTYPALVGGEEPMSLTSGIFADASQLFVMPDGSKLNAKCSACSTLQTSEERFRCESRIPPYVACGADRQSDPLIIEKVQDLLFRQQCKLVDVQYKLPIVSASGETDAASANVEPAPHDLHEFFKIVNETPDKIPLMDLKKRPSQIPASMLKKMDKIEGNEKVVIAKKIDFASYTKMVRKEPSFKWDEKGDTRYKFELKIAPQAKRFCKPAIDPKMQGKITEPDGTFVVCSVPANEGGQITSCDQLAAQIRNVAKGKAMECKVN